MISFKKVIWLFPNKLNLKLIDNQKVSPGNFCFPDSQSLFQISDFKSHDLKRLLFFRVKLFAIHWSVEMWKRRKRKHFYMKWTCYTLNSPGLNFFSRFFLTNLMDTCDFSITAQITWRVCLRALNKSWWSSTLYHSVASANLCYLYILVLICPEHVIDCFEL